MRAGGALVAEARAGWNDETGRAADTIPGLGLAEVVGARETDVQTVEKGKAALLAGEGLPGLKPGEVLPGRWYEETLEPSGPGARVVARFASGAPAAVVSAFGKGKTLVLGSYVSAAYVSQPEEAGRRFFDGLLDWAGVRRTVAVSGDPVEVRLRRVGPRAPGLRLQPRRDAGRDVGDAARAPGWPRRRGDRDRGSRSRRSPRPTASSGAAPSPRATCACCGSARASRYASSRIGRYSGNHMPRSTVFSRCSRISGSAWPSATARRIVAHATAKEHSRIRASSG